MENQQIIERRKEKIKEFFLSYEKVLLAIIVLFALVIRIYFFIQTNGQTYWWDEGEYMSTVKSWALDVPYDINHQRPPLFQLFGALLLMLGFSEKMLQFLLVVLPSAFVVLVTYWLGKEIFNGKVGLIAAFGSATMWSFLFWTTRFQPDFLSISFQLLGIMFYFRAMKQKSVKIALWAGLLMAAGFYFKITSLLVPMAIIIFVLINEGYTFIKNKVHWAALASYIGAFVPFMIWQYFEFGNPLSFAPSYASSAARAGRELGWMALDYYYNFVGSPNIYWMKAPMFWLMLIGIGYFIFRLVISFDLFIKEKERRLSGELLSLIVLLLVAWYYIFFTKGIIEDRWVFLITPFLFFFAANAGLIIANYLNKYYKNVGIILLIIAIAISGYWQFQHASSLIDIKKDSYRPVQDAALFMKQNSEKTDIIESISSTQVTAYSERKTHSYSEMNDSNFTEYLKENKPKYYMISIFEPHPAWAFQQLKGDDQSILWVMPYSDSSIHISPQGQVIKIDVKASFEKEGMKFNLVYPKEQIDGVFVYQITYQS